MKDPEPLGNWVCSLLERAGFAEDGEAVELPKRLDGATFPNCCAGVAGLLDAPPVTVTALTDRELVSESAWLTA